MLAEFRCPRCGALEEILVRSVDSMEDPNFMAPICSFCDLLMEYVEFPLTSFALKGTGWYKTDYK